MISGDIKNKIQRCKFGDGDLISEFNIQDQLNPLNNMIKSVDQALSITDPLSPNYVNTGAATTGIIAEMAFIANYRDGLFNDSNSAGYDNHYNSLKTMNSWSNHLNLGNF